MPIPFSGPLESEFPTEWAWSKNSKLVRKVCIDLIIRPVVHLVAPPTIRGTENVTKLDGGIIFAANHSSHLDTSLLLTALPKTARYNVVFAAAADYFFNTRIKAIWWALTVGAVPVERQKPRRDSIIRIWNELKAGRNVVIFPEGSRSTDGKIHEFKPGAAFLAVKSKTPVIPVHLGGTYDFLKKGQKMIRPRPTKVTYGEPLTANEGESIRSFNERLFQAVIAAGEN